MDYVRNKSLSGEFIRESTLAMRLRVLKGAQALVAIATTLAVGAGLLWPGVMGVFVLPVFLLYIIWAVRAAFDHRLSIWLSFAMTLAIAFLFGTIAFRSVLDISVDLEELISPNTTVVAHAGGELVELSADALPSWREAQARIDRQNRAQLRVEAGIFTSISLTAWLVVILSVLEWRWLSGRTFKNK